MVAGMSLLVRQFNLSVNLNNNDHNLLIRELDETKLKLSRLESVLEETIQSIDAKTLLLKEREKLFEDMENKITYLQSVISTLKDDSLLADESLRLYKRRKNNFELHVLESEAQDTEDRVEAVNLKVEKMAEVVTEQWIQIPHLEQHNCFLSYKGGHCKIKGKVEYYSFGKGSTIKYYMSQALQQLRRFYSAIKKYHHQVTLGDLHMSKLHKSDVSVMPDVSVDLVTNAVEGS
ncbi:hypothetical protein GOBAR_AA38806 [Gossypium barbadense]|uniref:Uncharacterized protein n=1 Tax=Gossypium barbadense TaxID=3634 RepID=A0A2P5VSX9_GOSBA|nr:hypothetical protein GOBAR_AA38806 [Gossypium barbadense]